MKNKSYDILEEIGIIEEEEIPEEKLISTSPDEDQKAVQKTVGSLMLIMGVLAVIELVLVLVFAGRSDGWVQGRWRAVLGLFIGLAISVGWLFSIKAQFKNGVGSEGTEIRKKIRIGAIIRYFILVAVLLTAYFTGFAHPILIIVGVFNLKIAAYLSGFFNKKDAQGAGPAV